MLIHQKSQNTQYFLKALKICKYIPKTLIPSHWLTHTLHITAVVITFVCFIHTMKYPMKVWSKKNSSLCSIKLIKNSLFTLLKVLPVY